MDYYYANDATVYQIRSIRLDGTERIEWDCGDLFCIYAVEDGWIITKVNRSSSVSGT